MKTTGSTSLTCAACLNDNIIIVGECRTTMCSYTCSRRSEKSRSLSGNEAANTEVEQYQGIYGKSSSIHRQVVVQEPQ